MINLWIFRAIIQLMEHFFLIWTPLFVLMVIRCKKCSDISEVTAGADTQLELKLTHNWNWKCAKWHPSDKFAFSALPPEVTYEMSQHFLKLCTVGQKSFCQIFKTWFISWIIGQNVQKLLICAAFPPYIALFKWILKYFGTFWNSGQVRESGKAKGVK